MCLSPGLLDTNIHYNNLINDGEFDSFVTFEMFKDIEKQSFNLGPIHIFVHYEHLSS